MRYATGTKTRFGYTMHKPEFPYDTVKYIGYTEKEMKQKYRQDNNLKYKKITWIILNGE